eukprot:PITA_24860
MKGIDTKTCIHQIYIEENSRPIRQPQRRMNPNLREIVKEELQKILNVNIIYPISDSRWVSPLVIVPKKNGKWRAWIDYRELNKATLKDHFPLPFIDQDIFTRFGVPREIVTDQGSQFTSNLMEKLMEEYKIKHRKSTPYHPQANGQVESTNKVLESIVTKTVDLHRRDWIERLPEALWAYKTTWRNTTGHSPYELVYGKEILFPIEFQVKTFKMAV